MLAADPLGRGAHALLPVAGGGASWSAGGEVRLSPLNLTTANFFHGIPLADYANLRQSS